MSEQIDSEMPAIDLKALSQSIKSEIIDNVAHDVKEKLNLTKEGEINASEAFHDIIGDLSDSERNELFMEAAKSGNTKLFKDLIRNKYPVKFDDPDVLMAACESGSYEIANLFFQYDPPAIIPFYQLEKLKFDCFQMSSTKGDLEFIKKTGVAWVLPRGRLEESIGDAMNRGYFELAHYLRFLILYFDYLRMASCTGRIDAIEEILSGPFLKSGPFLSETVDAFRDKAEFPPPLACAIIYGQVEVVKFFLALKESGVPMNLAYAYNLHLLLALKSGNLEIVKMLASYPEVSPFRTPEVSLREAVTSGNLQVVEWFFEEAKKRGVVVKSHVNGTPIKNATTSVPILRLLAANLPNDPTTSGLRKTTRLPRFVDSNQKVNIYKGETCEAMNLAVMKCISMSKFSIDKF